MTDLIVGMLVAHLIGWLCVVCGALLLLWLGGTR